MRAVVLVLKDRAVVEFGKAWRRRPRTRPFNVDFTRSRVTVRLIL